MTDNEDSNTMIFLQATGRPMHFYMRPCSERKRLKPLIEEHFGLLSSRAEADSIRLVEDPSLVKNDGYVLSTFITDCIRENKLLDIEPYRIHMDGGRQDKSRTEESDLDISVSDNRSVIKVTNAAKEKRGRAQYHLNEDMAIIKYILSEKRAEEVKGVRLWKDMEMLEVTKHTWQSMKYRYLKTILPTIQQYQLSRADAVRLVTGAGMDFPSTGSTPKKPTCNMWLSKGGLKGQTGNEKSPQPSTSGMNSRSTHSDRSPRKDSATSGSKRVIDDVDEEDLDDFDEHLISIATDASVDKSNQKPVKEGRIKNPVIKLSLREPDQINGSPNKIMSSTPKKGASTPVNEHSKLADVSLVHKERSLNSSSLTPQKYATPKKPKNAQAGDEDVLTTPGGKNMGLGSTQKSDIPGSPRRSSRVSARLTEGQAVHRPTDKAVTSAVDGATVTGVHSKSPKGRKRRGDMTSNVDQEMTEDDGSFYTVSEGAPNDLHNFIMADTEEENEGEGDQGDNTQDLELEDTAKIIDKLCDWLGLSEREVLHLIYRHDGDIDQAVRWVLNGTSVAGEPIWSQEDDELLEAAGGTSEMLNVKYGKERVLNHYRFLTS